MLLEGEGEKEPSWNTPEHAGVLNKVFPQENMVNQSLIFGHIRGINWPGGTRNSQLNIPATVFHMKEYKHPIVSYSLHPIPYKGEENKWETHV